jgi:Tol biopolymer transport system component
MSRHRLALSLLVIAICTLAFTLDAFSGQVSSPNLEIFVVNADGSGRHNLTRNPARDDHPRVSPDGRTVLFVRDRVSLRIMASNGTHMRELLSLEDLARPVWSHDGALIAFTSCPDLSRGDCKVGVLRRDGSGLVWIADAASPTWSATGRRFAFLTSFSPEFRVGPQAIAVANADGSDRRIVVRSWDDFMAQKLLPPGWSPRGSTIAFAAEGAGFPLYVMKVDGGSPARLVAADGYGPTWSPDGRRLAFYSTGLWTVRADGSGLRRLPRVRSSIGPRLPSWSPDGTRIAFVTRPLARLNLVVMNLKKRSFRVVARGVESRQPVWSRNSRKIYYVGSART